MGDANQEPSAPMLDPRSPAPLEPPAAEFAPSAPRPPIDLRFWLLVVAIGGVGGLLLRQTELAALIAVAGLFAASHAADLEPAHRMLYRAVAWIVPVAGVAAFLTMGGLLVHADALGRARTLGLAFAALGVGAAAALAFTPAASAVARRLFGVAQPSATLRLAGRIALLGALFYPPATIAFPLIIDSATQSGASLVGSDSLWSNLIGLSLVSFGAVGYRTRRDLPATLERLGLRAVEPRDWVVIAGGVVALVVLNAGAEAIQRTWLPSLWASDQRVNRMIAAGLSRPDTLLLGVSAGVGEELSLRGALQPKLGIFLTSLLFALLHVQYSWFGVGIILLLGLTLGTIRSHTSTTAAILVHGLYDMFAVFTVQPT